MKNQIRMVRSTTLQESATHKNVFGMMPHPERASEKALFNTDGKIIFESLISKVLEMTVLYSNA